MIRLHSGNALDGAADLHARATRRSRPRGSRRRRSFTRAFVADNKLLQREQKTASPAGCGPSPTAGRSRSAFGFLRLLAWGLHRVARAGGGAGRSAARARGASPGARAPLAPGPRGAGRSAVRSIAMLGLIAVPLAHHALVLALRSPDQPYSCPWSSAGSRSATGDASAARETVRAGRGVLQGWLG